MLQGPPRSRTSAADASGDLLGEALRVSESRYRRLFETARDGILLLDADTGRIEDVNPQLVDMLGYSQAEWLGKKLGEVGPFADRAEIGEMLAALQATGYVRYEGLPLRTRAGARVEVELVSSSYDCDGIRVIQCNIRDITERSNTEQSLQESESRYKRLIENSPDIVYRFSSQRGGIYYSSRVTSILGYSVEHLLSHPTLWNASIHPDDIAAVALAVQAYRTGSPFRIEYRIRDAHGNWRWFYDRAIGSQWEDGDFIVEGLAMDITERRLAQSRLAYLTRVHAVLSGINTLIVRVSDRDELFRESCRVAVEAAGFRMAMLAMIDRETGKVVPVASAGKSEDLMHDIRTTLASDQVASTTMVAQAIREKKPIVSNNSLEDPRLSQGDKYARAGVRSLVVLPLLVAGQAHGVLALYATESDFFHREELNLLQELAANVAFAIDHVDKQERLNYLAYYDVLTGLANRSLFLERLAQYTRSATSGEHRLAIGLIDLERFKNINDSLGRAAGDTLLKQVAEWLTRNIGDASLLARIDADHFAMLMPEVRHQGELMRRVENTIEAFQNNPFRLDDAVFRITAKVGVALFPHDGASADILFRNAEAALKQAKASGDRYLFYTKQMTASVASKLSLENQLRHALDHGQFVLHYQPKVNLVSGKVTSVEALIRWNDPGTGLMPPDQFIPMLEETGLINEVGRWALHQAAEDYLRWLGKGLRRSAHRGERVAAAIAPSGLHRPRSPRWSPATPGWRPDWNWKSPKA